jgi:two-component system CheB/CheR fusion protein
VTIEKKMSNSLKLAFVEDNEDTRNVMSCLLESKGFEVTQFSDGETASVEIPQLAPHVAVIDIGLPGKNGFELAQDIRRHENGKDIVLIALSGFGRESDRLQATAAGFDDHLTKPTRIDALCNVIANNLKQNGLKEL